jgi:hypothetical protein
MPEGVKITHTGTRDSGGQMRARDVEFRLKGVELHPALKMVLCDLAEQEFVNMKALAELATMMDQIINIVQGFSNVAENMKGTIDKFEKNYIKPETE